MRDFVRREGKAGVGVDVCCGGGYGAEGEVGCDLGGAVGEYNAYRFNPG